MYFVTFTPLLTLQLMVLYVLSSCPWLVRIFSQLLNTVSSLCFTFYKNWKRDKDFKCQGTSIFVLTQHSIPIVISRQYPPLMCIILANYQNEAIFIEYTDDKVMLVVLAIGPTLLCGHRKTNLILVYIAIHYIFSNFYQA